MPNNDWPFEETLDEFCDPNKWVERTETFAVPPQVAANMRRLGVTNEPSATALPLTVDALAELATMHWPQPAIESLEKREDRITFKWLGYQLVVFQNLYVEVYHLTPEGEVIESSATNGLNQRTEIFPRTNSATRSLEKTLGRALAGNPFTFATMDEEAARKAIETYADRVFLYWRGSRVGKGMIPLCGRHIKEWPSELGELRLAHLTIQLHVLLACCSAPTIQGVARELTEHYAGNRPFKCRACHYEKNFQSLGAFYGIEAIGRDCRGGNQEDGQGPLSRPEYGQPLIRFDDEATSS